MEKLSLSKLDAFFFDLDGCLYFGDRIAPGAAMLLSQLRFDNKITMFVTNNSTHTGMEVAAKLNEMGIVASESDVVTAADCAGAYVMDVVGHATVKVAGSRSLQRAIEQSGHRVLDWGDDHSAEVVLIGRDEGFSYEKLSAIVQEWMKGARLIATNPDAYHLGREGERIPETGSLTAALERIVGGTIEQFGKPDPYLFHYVMRRRKLRSEQCVMIGDNPFTDIAGGNAAGIRTVWVCGSDNGFVTDVNASSIVPDLKVPGLIELLSYYNSGNSSMKKFII